VIRPLTDADLPAAAALNDAAVPAVNALGLDGLTTLVPRCSVAVVADDGAGPVGLLLAMEPGVEYSSENYRWFSTHRPGSLYVDRIVVAPAAQGRGLGRALYRTAAAHALAHDHREITCEVNIDPPNPGSMAFHEGLGFTRVGEQSTTGGTVRVALLAIRTTELH
jgi:uncharacterized protein